MVKSSWIDQLVSDTIRTAGDAFGEGVRAASEALEQIAAGEVPGGARCTCKQFDPNKDDVLFKGRAETKSYEHAFADRSIAEHSYYGCVSVEDATFYGAVGAKVCSTLITPEEPIAPFSPFNVVEQIKQQLEFRQVDGASRASTASGGGSSRTSEVDNQSVSDDGVVVREDVPEREACMDFYEDFYEDGAAFNPIPRPPSTVRGSEVVSTAVRAAPWLLQAIPKRRAESKGERQGAVVPESIREDEALHHFREEEYDIGVPLVDTYAYDAEAAAAVEFQTFDTPRVDVEEVCVPEPPKRAEGVALQREEPIPMEPWEPQRISTLYQDEYIESSTVEPTPLYGAVSEFASPFAHEEEDVAAAAATDTRLQRPWPQLTKHAEDSYNPRLQNLHRPRKMPAQPPEQSESFLASQQGATDGKTALAQSSGLSSSSAAASGGFGASGSKLGGSVASRSQDGSQSAKDADRFVQKSSELSAKTSGRAGESKSVLAPTAAMNSTVVATLGGLTAGSGNKRTSSATRSKDDPKPDASSGPSRRVDDSKSVLAKSSGMKSTAATALGSLAANDNAASSRGNSRSAPRDESRRPRADDQFERATSSRSAPKDETKQSESRTRTSLEKEDKDTPAVAAKPGRVSDAIRERSASKVQSGSRGPRTIVSGVQSNSASAQLLGGLVMQSQQGQARKSQSRSRSSKPEGQSSAK